jgi:hypothetical protein
VTQPLPPLKCIDCAAPITRAGRKPAERCWKCYLVYRRANAVTLRHACCDCGASVTLSSKDTTRCLKCYRENLKRAKAPPKMVHVEPFGMMHVPEGNYIYYVRKGAQ